MQLGEITEVFQLDNADSHGRAVYHRRPTDAQCETTGDLNKKKSPPSVSPLKRAAYWTATMTKITQTELSPVPAPSLAHTFIQSLRDISADRAAEIDALVAERDSYRELAVAAIAEVGLLNTVVDRERESRLWLLAQYRALKSGETDGDPRLTAIDAAILSEAA